MRWCSVTHAETDPRQVLEKYLKISRAMGYNELLQIYNDKYFTLRYQDEETEYHLDDDCLRFVEGDLTEKGFEVFFSELELDAKDNIDMHYEACNPTFAHYTVYGTHDLLLVINSVQEKLTAVQGLKIDRITSGYVEWDEVHDRQCGDDSCQFTVTVEMDLDAL